MVKHIVLFRLTSFVDIKEKEDQLRKMEEIFSVLPGLLPFIIEFHTGKNITHKAHSWDFAIDSIFNNKKDLLLYQESPEHLEAIKKASVIAKEKAMVDYEY